MPVYQACSRRATIVLGDMDMGKERGEFPNSFGDVGFFDVGVEGVVHSAAVGMCDGFYQMASVRDRV